MTSPLTKQERAEIMRNLPLILGFAGAIDLRWFERYEATVMALERTIRELLRPDVCEHDRRGYREVNGVVSQYLCLECNEEIK